MSNAIQEKPKPFFFPITLCDKVPVRYGDNSKLTIDKMILLYTHSDETKMSGMPEVLVPDLSLFLPLFEEVQFPKSVNIRLSPSALQYVQTMKSWILDGYEARAFQFS